MKNTRVMTSFLTLSVLLFAFGCAHTKRPSLHSSFFGSSPQKVLWIQIPGLHPEHLFLLKMLKDQETEESYFEQATCLGQMWSFSPFLLRPSLEEELWMQQEGKWSAQNFCRESKDHFWERLTNQGVGIGFVEIGPKLSSCRSERLSEKSIGSKAFEQLTTWEITGGKSSGKEFLWQNFSDFQKGLKYSNSQCRDEYCLEISGQGMAQFLNHLGKQRGKSVTLILDNRYLKFLKEGKTFELRKILLQWDYLLGELLSRSSNQLLSDRLIVVTGANSQKLDFPKEGAVWASFLENNQLPSLQLMKRSSLSSPLWAFGAGSEQFCGTYHVKDLAKKLYPLNEQTERFQKREIKDTVK